MNTHNHSSNTRSRKQLMLSLLLVAVIVTSASAGTYAYFSAERTTNDNTFTAGTLDLNVSSNNVALAPFVIDNMGENGTIGGEKTWTVTNTGTLTGRFYLKLQNLSNAENACNDHERAVEPNCNQDNLGELGNVVKLKILVDGQEKASTTLATSDLNTLETKWNALPSILIAPGTSKSIKAIWSAGPNDYGNEIQSDSTKFDLNFQLLQNIAGQSQGA